MTVIQTKAPRKGDLVVGHRVWAFNGGDLPAVSGVITAATDATVTMDVGEFASILGLPRRTHWTWRRSVSAYQQRGTRTARGVGLALDCRPKPA